MHEEEIQLRRDMFQQIVTLLTEHHNTVSRQREQMINILNQLVGQEAPRGRK